MKSIIYMLKTIALLPFSFIRNIIRDIAYGKLNKERIEKGEEPIRY